MKNYKDELNYYTSVNKMMQKGGVVLFGSTFAKNISVAELCKAFDVDCNVYNRSFNDLSVFDAQELVSGAVMSLQPKKIILQLGETDVERNEKSDDEVISAYEKLISNIKKADKKVKIIVASLSSDENECDKFNKALESLAEKCRCQYVDISKAKTSDMPSVKAFSMLRCFIPDQVSFFDAMNFANVG